MRPSLRTSQTIEVLFLKDTRHHPMYTSEAKDKLNLTSGFRDLRMTLSAIAI
jgi:hypothetical protein